jgi:small subunit ribosomal protein S18
MARNSKVAKKTSSRKPRAAEGKGRLRRGRPKVCRFCSEHWPWVDYKNVNLLARFLNDRGRIKARSSTGTCAQHQRDVAAAIKTARELALLPYAVRTLAADPANRRGGGRRGPGGTPASAGTDVPQASGSEIGAGDADAVGRALVDDALEGVETTVASRQPTSPDTSPVATVS